jgi:hypothetical protein
MGGVNKFIRPFFIESKKRLLWTVLLSTALICSYSSAFAQGVDDHRPESLQTNTIQNSATGDVGPAPIKLAYRPPLDMLHAAVAATGSESKIEAVVAVAFDAEGLPTAVEFKTSSGYPALDTAIVEWTKQARFPTGMPGRGHLPFSFETKKTAGPIIATPSIVKRPSIRPVIEAMARTN